VRGPNGVGKSTLIETVAGLRTLHAGRIDWNALGFLGHKNALSPALTVQEIIDFYGGLYGARAEDRARALEDLALTHRRNVTVHMLSAGQKRRLALAVLILKQATLWILDEPSVSLDAEGIKTLEGLMHAHVSKGGSILFTSHVQLNIDAQTLDLSVMNFERTQKMCFSLCWAPRYGRCHTDFVLRWPGGAWSRLGLLFDCRVFVCAGDWR
ncbi:UNVERIFIED_CONTAM: hypothetical protein GTU68_015953, partial [Idotea baltica]|nr:hypothetical protein [Idotea baltica]